MTRISNCVLTCPILYTHTKILFILVGSFAFAVGTSDWQKVCQTVDKLENANLAKQDFEGTGKPMDKHRTNLHSLGIQQNFNNLL